MHQNGQNDQPAPQVVVQLVQAVQVVKVLQVVQYDQNERSLCTRGQVEQNGLLVLHPVQKQNGRRDDRFAPHQNDQNYQNGILKRRRCIAPRIQ